jgi:hypothetical protein
MCSDVFKGTGYDGSSGTMSNMRAAGFEVHKDAKNAAICPRHEHGLNLSNSEAGVVTAVKRAMGKRSIVTFFLFLMLHPKDILCSTSI